MKTKICIDYPIEEIKKSRERLNAVNRRVITDRVPILLDISTRYILEERKLTFPEYIESPKTHLYQQLMNIKYRAEKFHDDYMNEEAVTIIPDLQNTATAPNFDGVEVVWSDYNPPRVLHAIHSIEEIRKLRTPEPEDNYGGFRINFLMGMLECVDDFEVYIGNKQVPIKFETGWNEGPVSGSLDLMGENLMLWLIDYPGEMIEALSKVSQVTINMERVLRKIIGKTSGGIGLSGDGGEMLSASMFSEFFVPQLSTVFNAFPGNRMLHMCGGTNHLLEVLHKELKITHFCGYSYKVNNKKLLDEFGRDLVAIGNINPMTLLGSTIAQIKKEVFNILEDFKEYNNLILADGSNVPPSCPSENIMAVVQAASEFEYGR